MTLKNNLTEERRKFRRFECLIPSNVLELATKHNLIERATVHNFSTEGLKLVITYIDPVPGSSVNLKLYIPEKQLVTSFSGEVVWKKHSGNKLEIGLRIKQLDKHAKQEILDWIVPKWLQSEKIEKEKK